MNQPLAPNSLTAVALGAIVSGLERVERNMRGLEAERARLLAEALELAAVEGEQAQSTESDSEAATPNNPRGELALRAIRAEIATALHLSERTVDRHLDHAFALVRRLPAVFESLRTGEVSARHASVIVDAGTVIGTMDDASTRMRRGAYAEAALDAAADATPATLTARAKRIAEQYAETALEERHADARRRRRVWVEDREHGMADLYAHLPATEAYAIKDRLTRVARSIARAELAAETASNSSSESSSESSSGAASDLDPHSASAAATSNSPARRCRDEIRADALVDLLLRGRTGGDGADVAGSGASSTSGIHPIVQLIVPAAILAPTTGTEKAPGIGRGLGLSRAFSVDLPPGVDSPLSAALDGLVELPSYADSEHDEPAELIGYGPIAPSVARRLSSEAAHWERVLSDAETGEVLRVDRYRPSEQMRRFLRARDRHCRFPGCRAPVHHCDIDHTRDAALGGPTSTDNLAHLCRGHHTLKHHTGWRVKQDGSGTLEWTSPTGRIHRDRPPSRVRFRPAPTSVPDVPAPSVTNAQPASTSNTHPTSTSNAPPPPTPDAPTPSAPDARPPTPDAPPPAPTLNDPPY